MKRRHSSGLPTAPSKSSLLRTRREALAALAVGLSPLGCLDRSGLHGGSGGFAGSGGFGSGGFGSGGFGSGGLPGSGGLGSGGAPGSGGAVGTGGAGTGGA